MSTHYPVVTLKPHRDESLKRFHPWIFSGAIAHTSASVPIGDVVAVQSAAGEPLGFGFYEGGSIAVRMISNSPTPIDLPFLIQSRLTEAFEMRKALGLVTPGGEQANDTYRLCYGESDGLPGLIVDVYAQAAVVQVHARGIYPYLQTISRTLQELPGAGIRYVYNKSDATLPPTPHFTDTSDGYLTAPPQRQIIATENGLQFYPDWERGQKTGFFTDQRENRALVEHYARGKRVLNLFSYTGGFSLYALRGGACEVTSVDSSARAMEICEANVDLNRFAHPERHIPLLSDAFDFLKQTPQGRYDLMIVDPPAFAKQRRSLTHALAGYRRLNALALEKISSKGLVFTFSCSQAVSTTDFTLAVLTAAVQSKRKVQIIDRLTQAPDHPTSIYFSESDYLKGLLLYVTD